MKWLDKLERRYYRYAIPNLMQYIAGGMALVFVLDMLTSPLGNNLISQLGFSVRLILQGQIWRLVTFIFVPERSNPIFMIFYFMILMFFGRILEQNWGTFKFNIYFLIGSVGTILASVVLETLTGMPVPLTNFNLYMSLLLATAQVAPDYELRIYFILPVKLRYIGYIYGGILVYQFLFFGTATRILLLFTLLNFLIFFGPGIINRGRQNYRRQQFRQHHRPQPKARPSNNRNAKPKNGQVIQVAFHCCEVCGKTEVDDPTLEFRYCSKCDGRHEYCSEHIFNHEHIKEKEDTKS